MITKYTNGCSDTPTEFSMPPGVILPYGGASAPSGGWLLCDGSAVSRVAYAALFAVIGTAFGPGDGTTTFNLPPSGYFFFNKAAAGTGSILGDTFGAIDHVHSVDPPDTSTTTNGAHIHAVDPNSTTTSTDGAHTHTVDPAAATTSSDGAHTHTGTTSGPSSTTPTQLVLGAVASSTHTHTFTTDSNGAHTHTVDIASTTSSSNGNHSHTVDIPSTNTDSQGNHDHSVNISSFDSGISNPPGCAVNFIIKT